MGHFSRRRWAAAGTLGVMMWAARAGIPVDVRFSGVGWGMAGGTAVAGIIIGSFLVWGGLLGAGLWYSMRRLWANLASKNAPAQAGTV